MSYLFRRWPIRAGGTGWIVSAIAAAAALSLLALADTPISRFGGLLPEPGITVFTWITRLGDSDWILIPALVVTIVAGAIALASRSYTLKRAMLELARVSGFIFVGVGLPGLFTAIVKRIIGRGRPEGANLGIDGFEMFSWGDWAYQSFPSGHATTAFALCFVFAFLVPRWFPALLGLAVLIALSRIVVGAHFATDVLGGALVGTLGAYLVRNVFAARGWVFRFRPDHTVVARPPAALRRLLTRPGSSRPRP